ncbi:MAG TPA: LuxR C-terminal-related transcriptional regulator [Acidimicrobiales bacterium]|nr:LuxR C-terminal-related transcriptional regulator [Acidimicrobiales bacterium]
MSVEEMVVARAKFGVPRVPNATVRRDALVDRLDAADCPLTLVVAAPGSGKTALLAQWVGSADRSISWMSCDATDAQPLCFWRSLITSVAQTCHDLGIAAAELVEEPSTERLAIGLANELAALDERCVIVVDDFHLARPEPAVMAAFIAALPRSARLVIATRADPPFPLGRLRVQGKLLELRQPELALTNDEAHRVLADLGVVLGDDELRQLVTLTEGWPAGVHLAGLWARAHADPAGLLRTMGATDRSLVDFLMTEVIELQPPDIVDFLMVSAELEWFDAELCDEVRSRSDSAEMLARVRAANLFLIEPNREGAKYRYQHLFGQFLRAHLRAVAPERLPAIHRAAASASLSRRDPMSAVGHSLRARDPVSAMAQLQGHVTSAWSVENPALAGATVRAWLDEHEYPDAERTPEGVLVCAVVFGLLGDHDEAASWLRWVEAREADLDAPDRFLLHGVWTHHLVQVGDPGAALERAGRARAVAHEHAMDTVWADALTLVEVQAQLWLGDLVGAEATLEPDRMRPDLSPVIRRVRRPGCASLIALQRGELVEAEGLANAAIAAADELGLDDGNFGRAEPEFALAQLALERNRLDDADCRLERVMRIVEEGRRPPIEMVAHVRRAQVASARGEYEAAADAIERARAAIPHATPPVVAWIDRAELRLALDRRDRVTADLVQPRLPPSPETELLTARLRLLADDPPGALSALETVADGTSTRRLRVEQQLLTAIALARSDPPRAHKALDSALTLAEPVGLHRTVLAEGPVVWSLLEAHPAHGRTADYIARILENTHRVRHPPPTTSQPGLVDPLSERERTVLRLLASRLTSTEIARELYLSVNTVRSHVKAIYRKLGVNARVDAVKRGHALGIA